MLRHCWVVKLSRMKLTLVANLRLYSQRYGVEMALNPTCVVCWICLYSKTKWTVPFPGSKKKLLLGRTVAIFFRRMNITALLRDLWFALFGACWRTGIIPSEWRRSLGVSVPKKLGGGRWKGVPREERLCRECGMNEVEDYDHWLLRCLRWDIERRHLLTNVQQRLPNFASAIDDMQRSSVITDLACEDCRTAQVIYSVWTARFG